MIISVELWIESAKHSNKGYNYLQLARFDCDTKPYLSVFINDKVMNTMIKIRTGNIELMTEIGRYRNRIPYEECLCKSCDNEKIEDLFHFMIECPRYDDIRRRVAPALSNIDRSDFHVLMNSARPQVLKSITMFFDQANARRPGTLRDEV